MPFDINKLFSDPTFQIGASILGNSGTPGIVGQAFANAQRVNQLKAEAEMQRRRTTLAEQEAQSNEAYRRDALAQRKQEGEAEAEYRRSQADMMRQQQARLAREQTMQENFFRMVAPLFGIDPNALMPQAGAEGEAQPPQAPQAPGIEMGPVPPAATPGGMRPRGLTQVVPELPGGAHIQQIPGYNPSEQDTAGPLYRGQLGQRQLTGPGRGMMKTGGGFGTPPELLDRLMQVESSGNPRAINANSGAMGAYQFMPGTIDMLRKQGMAFNPFDPQQARTAADYLLSQLYNKHGSWEGALAAYGGFKTKDPTSYISKVMAGTAAPPAQQSGAQAEPLPNKGMKLIQLGALGGMVKGMPGASGLIELGKAMAPQNVQAGSYQRDPTTGQTTFVGDPYREKSLGLEEQRLGMEGQRVANDTRKTDAELGKMNTEQQAQVLKTQQAKAQGLQSYRTINQNLDMMEGTINNILGSPQGLENNTGWRGALGFGSIPGTAGKDTQVQITRLKSQQMVETLKALKAESANGGSGFGNLSEKEGETLRTLIANLDSAQTKQSMVKALQDAKDWVGTMRSNLNEVYKNTYGETPPQVRRHTGGSVAMPQVGEVRKGYRYKGGDPKSPQSWERAA